MTLVPVNSSTSKKQRDQNRIEEKTFTVDFPTPTEHVVLISCVALICTYPFDLYAFDSCREPARRNEKSKVSLIDFILAANFMVSSVGAPNFLKTLRKHSDLFLLVSTAQTVQLPAVYPLVNILLPLLNNVYNLLLSLLSVFDTLPPSVSCLIPVDLGAVETSLLKLYSQALAIVNFLSSLPEYAAGSAPAAPPSGNDSLQGVITTLLEAISGIAEGTLVGIGGGLLPGVLKLVVMVLQALLNVLI
ncbi:hypothetical protein EVAR_100292_1 [Eumeta japonica]|uniref:Uncharacterized protein n=1 Tax=Eumeta variegata TaxID=151549 RepID=A0A4C2A690_EUMVA|nr:hypothetical protein EVAR_100292_1 [Eumeta japonica]